MFSAVKQQGKARNLAFLDSKTLYLPPRTSQVSMRVESSLKGPMSPCTTDPFSSRITEDEGGTEMDKICKIWILMLC